MKNLLKSLLCASLIPFAFAACNKKENTKVLIKNKQKAKYAVATMQWLGGEDRRIAFETLSPLEVREFWIEHINHFAEVRNLTNAQNATISNLLTFIENHTLDENAQTIIQDFQSVWLPNALQVFTNEEVFLLAYSLYDNVEDDYAGLVNVNGSGGNGTSNPPKQCQCEVGSTFWACGLKPNQCEKVNCIATTSCGFLLMAECDGRCNVLKG